jgi:hypothetical protein
VTNFICKPIPTELASAAACNPSSSPTLTIALFSPSLLSVNMPSIDVDYEELVRTLSDNFNILADQFQILSDRNLTLSHKLAFAREQVRILLALKSHHPANLSKILVPASISVPYIRPPSAYLKTRH